MTKNENSLFFSVFGILTRMHSSMMRTARLRIDPHMLGGGGWQVNDLSFLGGWVGWGGVVVLSKGVGGGGGGG